MKASDIVVGGVYSNGKGRVRKVTARGPEYKFYESAADTDCVQYSILKGGSSGDYASDTHGHNMSVASFAVWAKERKDSTAARNGV